MQMKKVLAVLLALAMVVLCFAGCGGTKAGGTGDQTLKIGASGPLTGNNAQYGIGVKNAAQLAVDEINAAGGVNGYKLEFRMEDDESAAEKAVNAYNTLKDWGMQLSLGTVTSDACIAFQGVAKGDNMFILTPSASAVESIDGDNAFRVCFSDPNQGIASADYIAANNVAKKVAIIYDSSNAYSTGIYEKFVDEAKAKGLEIVTEQSFTADSKDDFSAQVQAVKNAGAELVFLPIYYSEAYSIITSGKTAGLSVKYFGCDGIDGILEIKNLDKSLVEGVMLLTPFAADATDKATVHFVTKYKETYNNETPNQFAADAYDAVYTIKAALEKANVKADMSASDVCDALKAVMPQITVDGVTGAGITWDKNGEPTKAPKAVVIKDGGYKAL